MNSSGSRLTLNTYCPTPLSGREAVLRARRTGSPDSQRTTALKSICTPRLGREPLGFAWPGVSTGGLISRLTSRTHAE